MKNKTLKAKLKKQKKTIRYLQESVAMLSRETREQKRMLQRAQALMAESSHDIADGINETETLKEQLKNCHESFMSLSMENHGLKRELYSIRHGGLG